MGRKGARKFGKLFYNLWARNMTKGKANILARIQRRKGNRARVVKEGKGWSVFRKRITLAELKAIRGKKPRKALRKLKRMRQ